MARRVCSRLWTTQRQSKCKSPCEHHVRKGESAWRIFKDLFDEYVHKNQSYSNAAKMHYLKLSLKGDAAKLVGHIAPSADNYLTCYETLMNRYENKREIVNKLINAIMKIPFQKHETSDGLKFMHDTTNENLLALKNVGIDTKSWDPIVVNILLRKLDSKTILDYEMSLTNVREPPKLNNFLKYIENRFMAMASAENSNKKFEKEKNDQAKNDNKDVPFKCTFCEKPHSIYKCNDFKDLEVKKRAEFIRE